MKSKRMKVRIGPHFMSKSITALIAALLLHQALKTPPSGEASFGVSLFDSIARYEGPEFFSYSLIAMFFGYCLYYLVRGVLEHETGEITGWLDNIADPVFLLVTWIGLIISWPNGILLLEAPSSVLPFVFGYTYIYAGGVLIILFGAYMVVSMWSAVQSFNREPETQPVETLSKPSSIKGLALALCLIALFGILSRLGRKS